MLILVTLSEITGDVSLLSSVGVILAAVFVAVQLTQNSRMLKVAVDQAQAAAVQARLSNEQLKQNNELANMDFVMRPYEFANSSEFQSAWLIVLNTKVTSFEELRNFRPRRRYPFTRWRRSSNRSASSSRRK